jgi:hypothetical protein
MGLSVFPGWVGSVNAGLIGAKNPAGNCAPPESDPTDGAKSAREFVSLARQMRTGNGGGLETVAP